MNRRTHFYAKEKRQGGVTWEKDVKTVTGDVFFFTFPLLSQISETSTNDCTLVTIKNLPRASPSLWVSFCAPLSHTPVKGAEMQGREGFSWRGRSQPRPPCPLPLRESRPDLAAPGKSCAPPAWSLSKRTTPPSTRGSLGAASPMDPGP